MSLPFACLKGFKVYQVDVKSSFLNGDLKDEAYFKQLEGLGLSKNKDYVWKLKKALYGLKKAPRPWYERLDHYVEQQDFKRVVADNNLYIKMENYNLLITLVYADDLIFESNNDDMSHEFSQEMSNKFEMSIIGELSFFLGLSFSNRWRNIHFQNQIH